MVMYQCQFPNCKYTIVMKNDNKKGNLVWDLGGALHNFCKFSINPKLF